MYFDVVDGWQKLMILIGTMQIMVGLLIHFSAFTTVNQMHLKGPCQKEIRQICWDLTTKISGGLVLDLMYDTFAIIDIRFILGRSIFVDKYLGKFYAYHFNFRLDTVKNIPENGYGSTPTALFNGLIGPQINLMTITDNNAWLTFDTHPLA